MMGQGPAHRTDLLRLVVDHLTTAVLLFDGELRLHLLNPAGEALLALSAKKAVGLRPEEIFPEAPEWAAILRRSSRTRHAYTEHEILLRRPGGPTVTVECSVSPCCDAGLGDALLVELVRTDSHLRIAREGQFQSQHETALAMVRGLAHEIRNPLGGLRGAAQLLQRELADPALQEYTNVIIGEADRLQNLLDRLLGPRTLPQKRRINIHQVAERVCWLVKAEIPLGVRLRCDYDPSIPDLVADPDLLIQAVLNIVRNAVQAVAGCGRVTVRTRVQRHVSVGQRHHRLVVRLDVVDDGPGIPAEMLEKVFYPMVSGRPGGTGLGLAIAQSLVQQHGGAIQCASRPGETVMSILLPLENGE